jgi:hypothetical protein
MLKIFSTIILVVSGCTAWGQAFAPLNAKWHYANYCNVPPWVGDCGYFTAEAVRDTMVNGLMATVVEHRSMGVLTPQSEVLIREDDNRVYFFENGQFKLLYDFNLEVGDTLTFSVPQNSQLYDFSCGMASDTSRFAQVVVVSTTITEIDGQQLKTLHTSAINFEDLEYLSWELGSFTERIGSYNGLFGVSTTACLGGFPGHFRCYDDPIISYVASTEACDFVMGQRELTAKSGISIHPNPAYSMIQVKSLFEKIVGYRVSTICGQTLLERKIVPSVTIGVDLDYLSPGIYVVETYGISGSTVREKIIKLNSN